MISLRAGVKACKRPYNFYYLFVYVKVTMTICYLKKIHDHIGTAAPPFPQTCGRMRSGPPSIEGRKSLAPKFVYLPMFLHTKVDM